MMFQQLPVKMKGALSKIEFLLTIVDVFGANVMLPLLGPVHHNVIIKMPKEIIFQSLYK